MADDNEFGDFSSVSEWSELNHVTASFNPDWLNQDWASGVIPNNEHPWNESLPELPKELSNLLTDDVTSLGDTLPTSITNLTTNAGGDDLFGDFESSLNNTEVVMTTNKPITDINAPTSVQGSNMDSAIITHSSGTGAVTGEVNSQVNNDDDEFGEFEGPSIPKQPDMVLGANIVASELHDEEEEFGGFVSTTSEVKENVSADDDFGSFETAEFGAASSFPPLQAVQPTTSTVGAPPTNFGATPTSKSPPTFSTVAESCFQCDPTGVDDYSTIDKPLDTLAEQSSLWSSVQLGLKTTSPLYSWNKSHIEDQYFSALKVDPMLVYTILSFAEEMGMVPLAAQDRQLADEGFQWPDSPTEQRPQEVAATLLDLTLSSPLPTTSSKAMSRHDSFTLDADLMGLDFTLTDDPQPTIMEGEGLPDPVITAESSSKTADAIADMLGLTTNPYLTSKDDKNDQVVSNDNDQLTSKETQPVTEGDNDNTLFANGMFTSDTPYAAMESLSLSQPLESSVVAKDELQSLTPSQENLETLKVSPTILQSSAEGDSKPVTDDNKPMTLSNAALDLLSSLPVLPAETSRSVALSTMAQQLLTSLPDVTFMLSNTHTKHS